MDAVSKREDAHQSACAVTGVLDCQHKFHHVREHNNMQPAYFSLDIVQDMTIELVTSDSP